MKINFKANIVLTKGQINLITSGCRQWALISRHEHEANILPLPPGLLRGCPALPGGAGGQDGGEAGRLEAELAAKDERIAALEAAEATQAGWYECAWREEWTGTYLDHSNITYETLLHSSTGGGAGLNITTGIFTAPYSGVWTVRERFDWLSIA